ncbi:hypothetical protein CD351_09915 [Erythrobacter sp. KY5]|uniref:hypothetical protein n=1 Tax=Erythrobacter sp. KY5 TaxID=2011159 RepID=UPI000DBF0EDE|nr:hypothetical protein [Erythrobacter sp. KY5]AWW74738.1 hypothetical protein CD351_09915 [Erythrobacter sp. KY5]
MSLPPIQGWNNRQDDAAFSDPVDCAARAGKFERRVRIRNIIEYAAAVFVIILFSGMAVGAIMRDEFLIALSAILTVAGIIIVVVGLRRRASNLERRPEDACVVHLRRQYQRQYEALRDVPRWYLAPLMPGVILFYYAVTAKVAEVMGWLRAIEGAAGPAAITFGIFALVALANWIGARALKKKVDEIEALA